MYITCLDMEGVLVPEIWIAFAQASGIPELKRTTRDEPDYNKLMQYRLNILREHRLGLKEIQQTIAGIDPLPGAKEFLDELRTLTQVIILSDTFEQFAKPLMKKLDWPTIFCNTLEVAGDAAGASVEKRIRLAVRIGLSCANDLERCVNEMTDLVGTGSPANEAVPAAFGFLVSAGGDVMETIYRSVNAGNASSAVATMAGAMAGALRGCAGLPPRHLEYLSDVNGMDLAGTARAVSALI